MSAAPDVQSRWNQLARPQFNLRLLLLVVALLAVLSAWGGALRQNEQAERAVQRMRSEARLDTQIRYRDSMLNHLKERLKIAGANDPHVASTTVQIRKLDADIADTRKAIRDLGQAPLPPRQ